MEIRRATEADFDAIRDVAYAAWKATYDDILDEDTITRTVEEWYAPDALRTLIDQRETDFLVADDGGVVAFCHGVSTANEGDIVRLYTHPDRWDEGIGYRLYERFRDDLRDDGVAEMRAIVVDGDEMAETLFTRMGFRKSGSGSVTMADQEVAESVYSRAV
ncbi:MULTISPECIES: GNAT family N-acetyltransferase [unclassified Haladaptatus]|uniref:GNAT family N-acetyltransferase n=1 Tax=unclassified Haladaptatus TaxID=2622732 RepID=UPI0023E7A130|nr:MULTISPECIES: GNAT family N-acetyltransferase [unclassified Haladaptatus]